MRIIATITFLGVLCTATYPFGNTARSACISNNLLFNESFLQQTDTAKKSVDTGVVGIASPKKSIEKKLQSKGNKLDPKKLSVFPALSLQQYLKGESAGLYVQEPSGEPGTVQHMFIHGTSQPLLSARELFATQPLVVLDGVPLVGEHPFAFDIQQFKYDRIGPATNTLANINMANIKSIEVLKDLSSTAIYGPKGANGVILITTNAPGTKRKITFDSYVGLAQPNSVTTINGKFENDFRRQFYNKYTANGNYSENDVYPLYLSDSLNNAFYGPSNWNDKYYNSEVVYGVNASISGGTDRANFRFSLGTLRSGGVADDTGADRYDTRFIINMKPVSWFTVSAMVNANQIMRQRNRNVRDRLSQVNYIPDLSSPIAPNKDYYSGYLSEFNKGFDKNKTNIIEGYVKLGVNLGKFNFISTLGLDYNEGTRDIFFARTLLQSTNYASNYYGYNQRATIDNVATYDYDLNEDHKFNFSVGSIIQYDKYRYSYAYAYKGSNDFIKLNLLESDPNNGNYLQPTVFRRELVYKFLDKTRNNQVSFYGKADYTYKEKYSFSAILRGDASSNQQPTNRWFYAPVFSAGWDIKKELLADNSSVSSLNLRASAGRMGRYENFDNYAQGPQYTAFIGFTGNLISPGYNGFAVLNRPYTAGSVGYDLKWAYTDQASLGINGSFLNDRINASIDAYFKEDKNMLLGVPSGAEYGYTSIIKNGMAIRNTGVDLAISANILPAEKLFSWNSSINLNFNQNKLTALPGGLDQLIIGDRLLKIGEAVDRYWVLTNEGIYNTDSEVPVNSGGYRLSYNGIGLKAGDPRWKDLNGDGAITNEDRTLTGHALPQVSGGFNNDFSYKKWTLGLNFYFNLGRELVNQEMANRFDFVNREGQNNINSVREITFWEKRGDYSKYLLYNPWSSVAPYQANQDIFVEDASFLKLRTLSLTYDLTEFFKKKAANVQKFQVYGSVHNVFTLTKYTGQDPELVSYTGYDTGYGMQIPRTFTLGVKMDF
ncbi:SusC/RagA family TonB-linked outer membrane protein [Pedobacter frigoris]|uniref:SusC/RagA family TonB-linked outer membrane protein n=1 Tax=Pedobacter frigoris TaxID=2571272 RepID=A0A4U1CMR3_9SPHI|nr:SusC/RagA family TonB-linked outer membrane protein [Pedobacter frigoris]TKC09177.1 SusC/RagA family TonB-linked outer membrane protein [Pedobacter frigoris]